MSTTPLDQLAIPLSQEKLEAFCERNHIRKLALYGSVLRDDFTPNSDIDVLVEFDPAAIIGWKIVSIADEFSKLLGREVDFGTFDGLNPHIRDAVLRNIQVLYERAG